MNHKKKEYTFDQRMQLLIIRIVLSVFVFINVAVFTIPEISENKLVYHLVGIMDTVIGIIVGYYWGSSKGSKDKDEMIKAKEDEQRVS